MNISYSVSLLVVNSFSLFEDVLILPLFLKDNFAGMEFYVDELFFQYFRDIAQLYSAYIVCIFFYHF